MSVKKILLFLILPGAITNHAQDTLRPTELTEEVVISANKFRENKKYIAQKIDVIQATDLLRSISNNTASLLEQSGKVFVQKSQLGGGSPVIRGFEASRILLIVDGVKLNNAIYRTGHLQNVITIDDAILERVEVLYGPSSTIYGSDALGGVIHLITKQPELAVDSNFISRANASLKYGSAAQEWAGHADISLGGRKVASLTSVSYSSFGDLRQGNIRNPFYGDFGKRKQYVHQVSGMDSVIDNKDLNVQKASGYQQYDILQKITWQPGINLSHNLNFQYSSTSDIPRYDRLTDKRDGQLRWAEWYYGPQKRLLAAYMLRARYLNFFFDQLQFGINYQNIEESRMQRPYRVPKRDNRIENINVFAANLDLRKSHGRNELSIGMDGQFNFLKSVAYRQDISTGIRSYDLDSRYPDGKNNMNHVGIYLQHLYKIIPDKLILNDGVRFNYSSLRSTFVDTSIFHLPFASASQDNLTYSGNVGLVYLPGPKTKVDFAASTGFRVPNIDDLAKVFESAGGEQLVVPNPQLKPEQTFNFDMAVSHSALDWIHIDLNVFYTLFRNAIVLDQFTLNGHDMVEYNGRMTPVVANQNKAKARIYGFQGSLRLSPLRGVSVYSHLNFTYGRYIDPNNELVPMDHIPPIYGKTGIHFTHRPFILELFTRYNGWKHLKDYNPFGEDNLNYATPFGMPSWFTLNCATSFQFNKNFSLQIALENILDQNYRVFASGISAPGRNFIARLRTSF